MWWCTRVSTFVVHTQVSDVRHEMLWASLLHCTTCISCLRSTSTLLQAGAVGHEGCCGPMLNLRRLKVLQPVSIDTTGAHVSFAWLWQSGYPLRCTQSDEWRLMLSSEALFMRHSGEPGQLLGIYIAFNFIEIWKTYPHLDSHYLNPPWEAAGFWLLTSHHVLHSVRQILDCPPRWHAISIPQIKYSRINILVLNFSFRHLELPYKLLALITWKKILIN